MDGEELLANRLALKLTQQQMADALGITRTFLGLLERGKRRISKTIENASKSVRPIAMNHPKDSDPAIREIERALISQGMKYNTHFVSDSQIFDIYIPDLSTAVVIDKDMTAIHRPTRSIRNVIIARGGQADQIIATLLQGGQLRCSISDFTPSSDTFSVAGYADD